MSASLAAEQARSEAVVERRRKMALLVVAEEDALRKHVAIGMVASNTSIVTAGLAVRVWLTILVP